MFLNILVCVDGSPSSRRALDYGIDLARAGNAKLTLIAVAPPVSSYVTLGGVSTEAMRLELDRWAEGLLANADALVPEDVSAHSVQRAGSAGPEIVKELERGGYDLIILGSRGRGQAESTLFGSVGGYVHFHSRVPLLSVPDDGTGPPIDDGRAR
jgi:nucleotide-binding universal stress UspA family protein